MGYRVLMVAILVCGGVLVRVLANDASLASNLFVAAATLTVAGGLGITSRENGGSK